MSCNAVLRLADIAELQRRENVILATEAIRDPSIEKIAALMKIIHQQSAALSLLSDRRNWTARAKGKMYVWEWIGTKTLANPLKIATNAMEKS